MTSLEPSIARRARGSPGLLAEREDVRRRQVAVPFGAAILALAALPGAVT